MLKSLSISLILRGILALMLGILALPRLAARPGPCWVVPGYLRSALPRTTIIAAIHDRTFDHLPVPADATVRLAAGSVLRVT